MPEYQGGVKGAGSAGPREGAGFSGDRCSGAAWCVKEESEANVAKTQ